MSESRWLRRLGPGLAATIAVLAVAATTFGARDRPWRPPACTGHEPVPGTAASDVWWRLDPRLEAGALIGHRLLLARAGQTRRRMLELPPESFAAGPVAGRVLVGADDGVRSSLRLIDLAHGCALSLDERSQVIRRATVSPDGRDLVEFRLDRSTRTDLGVFRRPLTGGRWRQVLPPIPVDRRYGPTWSTELRWSLDGRLLGVQSCGAIACRTRIADPQGRRLDVPDDLDQGELIGLADGRAVFRAACGGLPCPIVAVDLSTRARTVLHATAGQAVLMLDDEARPIVVHEIGASGDRLGVVRLDGGGRRILPAESGGWRLVPADGSGGTTRVSGWVVLGPDGRLPADGGAGPILRRLATGATTRLEEVVR